MWLYIAFSSNYIFPKKHSSSLSASFPVPSQLVLQHSNLAWWGPGNETISIMYTCEPSWAKACVALQLSLQHEEIVGAFQIIRIIPYMDNDWTIQTLEWTHVNTDKFLDWFRAFPIIAKWPEQQWLLCARFYCLNMSTNYNTNVSPESLSIPCS